MFKFNITGDCLRLDFPRPLNSGSKGYYIAEFSFDSDWDGLIPHITIIENGTPRVDEVIVDNTYKIPTTESGVMQISVYGLDSEGKKCISCNYVCIEVKPGGYNGVAPLPKDIWDGYQLVVLGYVERAEIAADKAESMKTRGPVIGENGNWWIYVPELDEYVDTYESAHGETGPQGEKGETGEQGPAGPKGDTPKKGVDYWTETDKEEMVNAVLDALPNLEEVAY